MKQEFNLGQLLDVDFKLFQVHTEIDDVLSNTDSFLYVFTFEFFRTDLVNVFNISLSLKEDLNYFPKTIEDFE